MDNPEFPNICVIIPAYQPGDALLALVEQLLPFHYQQIVVVNDGSDSSKQPIFQQLEQLPAITVLSHSKNLGKGEALKTGMKWVLNQYKDNLIGIITVDADGQHIPKDIKKISQELVQNPTNLILGVRKFNEKVPLRSHFGNLLTRALFRWKYKFKITDTQTGLRAIPLNLVKKIITIPGSGYEYEMAYLIEAVKTGRPIKQVEIDTIYLDQNVSSHFNPIVDSMRIYYVFMRFAIISISSYLIDLFLFIILHQLTKTIFISLFFARLVSSSFNFYQNKFVVYHSHDLNLLKRELFKYILLALIVLCLSYLLIIFCIRYLRLGIIVSKILVDAFLFLINFFLQRKLVFGN
jgi:putative flippase GtrA